MIQMTQGKQHQAENDLPAFPLTIPADATPLEAAIMRMVAKARAS